MEKKKGLKQYIEDEDEREEREDLFEHDNKSYRLFPCLCCVHLDDPPIYCKACRHYVR